MDPRKLFTDQRHAAFCVYCGDQPSTREHVPSKALLDEPFPPNLPVVGSCAACNNGYSQDEEYFAVAVECAACNSADPDAVQRPRIARKLRESPGLAARISGAVTQLDFWGVRSVRLERDRVERVMLKLARGHAAYEFGEPVLDEPSESWIGPLAEMSETARRDFETAPEPSLFPEIGSRAFLRVIAMGGSGFALDDWQVVQEGRYRYLVSPSPFLVRLVVGEYLAAEFRWE